MDEQLNSDKTEIEKEDIDLQDYQDNIIDEKEIDNIIKLDNSNHFLNDNNNNNNNINYREQIFNEENMQFEQDNDMNNNNNSKIENNGNYIHTYTNEKLNKINNIINKNNYMFMTPNNHYNNTRIKNKNNKEKANSYLSRFDKFNKEQNKIYDINKQYSNFKDHNNDNFLERMNFDIFRRNYKELRLNNLMNLKKDKENEKKRIMIFNRLVEDADKRIKQRQKLNNSKNILNKDFISAEKVSKKYSDKEWNKIYQRRFKSYQDNINKKKEENRKFYEDKKKQEEDEIINSKPNKKASNEHILEVSKRMYDEAKKRKIKMEEKKVNKKDLNDTDDSVSKYVKKISSEPYNFDDNINFSEKDNFDSNDIILKQFLLEDNKSIKEYNNIQKKNNVVKKKKPLSITKNKRMAVSEFNNIRFDYKNKNKNKNKKKGIYSARYIHKNKRYIPDSNNIINIKDDNFINGKKSDNIAIIDGKRYDLDEERKILIKMASERKLQNNKNNYKLNQERNKSSDKLMRRAINSESQDLIYQFFLKQLEAEED